MCSKSLCTGSCEAGEVIVRLKWVSNILLVLHIDQCVAGLLQTEWPDSI
jgi:hypothetical protein